MKRFLCAMVACLPVSADRKRKWQYALSRSPETVIALRSPGRTDEADLAKKMRYAQRKYGLSYEEYFLYGIDRGEDARDYLGEWGRYALYRKINPKRGEKIYGDKAKTYAFFAPYYGRKLIPIRGIGDKSAFLSLVGGGCEIVQKPLRGSCGEDVSLYAVTAENADAVFKRLLASAPVVCEERIVSDPSLALPNPDSLNTVRLLTCVASDGSVSVVRPYIRLGRRGQITDNGGSGGIFLPIDGKTGATVPPGRDEAGRYYRFHPDSGVDLSFAIPRFDEAVSLVCALAAKTPDCRLIGWDLALTGDGWVVVEANYRSQLIGQQLFGSGCRAEIESLLS